MATKEYSISFTPTDALSIDTNELSWQVVDQFPSPTVVIASGTATAGTPFDTGTITDSSLDSEHNDRVLVVLDGAGNSDTETFEISLSVQVSPSFIAESTFTVIPTVVQVQLVAPEFLAESVFTVIPTVVLVQLVEPTFTAESTFEAVASVPVRISVDFSATSTLDISAHATVHVAPEFIAESTFVAAPYTIKINRGLRVRADFSDPDGVAIGGPVVDILEGSYSLEVDGIGSFELAMPAQHPLTSELVSGTQADIYFEGEGHVFRGKFDTPQITISDGFARLNLTDGSSVARELVYANTLYGRAYSNVPLANAVADLLTGTGWTGSVETTDANLTAQYEGAPIWKALVNAAERFQFHIRENPLTRTIEMGEFGADSGLVFQNVTHVERDMGVIPLTNLQITSSQKELWNRVLPRGGGEGINALTLKHSDRTTPYTIHTATGPDGREYYYIQDDASIAAHGLRIKPIAANDITPISNSNAEIVHAANALYDVAAAWLGWHSQPHTTYEIEIEGLRHYDNGVPLFKVGDTARLIYRGLATDIDGETRVWVDVDETVYIRAFERRFSVGQTNQWRLTIGTSDQAEPSAEKAISEAIESLWSIKTANHPTNYREVHGPYVQSVDADHDAEFLVEYDSTVTYLHQALLQVRKRPVKSNVKGAAAGGGETTEFAGVHDHAIQADTTVSGGTPTSQGGSPHDHSVSGQTTILDGQHRHAIGQATNLQPMSTWSHEQQLILRKDGGNFGVYVGRKGTSDSFESLFTNIDGIHQHNVQGTTSSVESSHTHQISPHDHSINARTTESSISHRHDLPLHDHALIYGIFEGPSANNPSFTVKINGTDYTDEVGGPFDDDFQVDITKYLVDAQGFVLRQSNNVVIGSNQLCDIEVTVRGYTTAHSVVPV